MATESLIYIYRPPQTYGVSEFLANQVKAQLDEHGVEAARIVDITDASYLNHDHFDQGCLVIPGGHTLLLGESLSSVAVKVKAQVKQGTLNYLGFCSGGNLACRDLQMGEGFLEENFLGLVPEYAVWRKGEDVVPLYSDGNEKPYHVYANNGSSYKISDYTCRYGEVLAKYEDDTVAVHVTEYGRGRVVRTGVHPEVTPESFIEVHKTAKIEIDPELREKCLLMDNDGRKELMTALFNSAHIIGT